MKMKNLKLLVSRLEAQLDSPEAARFNMHHFGARFMKNGSGVLEGVTPVCKTQACLAGETVLATGSGRVSENGGILLGIDEYTASLSIRYRATSDLGLTEKQAERLFYFREWTTRKLYGWPTRFAKAYEAAKTPQGRLYVAIRRVEHFIKMKGSE